MTCDKPVVLITGNSAACGHCHEVVYPEAQVIKNHNFTCRAGIAIWYSRDMEVTVHRCDHWLTQVTDQNLIDLTERISV